ncbi:hypothetical protein E4H04_13310 [Candidatus Bathyarchaeota archaeon]|nr:MAG: hypothetical protein E4H04_13310 [Candidatus Bathyarchaeota archaeon]
MHSGTYDTTSFSITSAPPGGGPPPSGGGPGGVVAPMIPSLQVIRARAPKEAALLLKGFDAKDVAKLLFQLNDEPHLLKILENFKPSYSLQIIRLSDNAGKLLLEMSREMMINILSEANEGDYPLIGSMFDYDKNITAQAIEDLIKEKTAGLEDVERRIQLTQIASVIGKAEKTTLVEIFITIAKLPDTPSTVAYLIESMKTSDAVDTIELWITDESYAGALNELLNVIKYMDANIFGEIYKRLSWEARSLLLESLPETTIASLPEVTVFQTMELTINPIEGYPGDIFTVVYAIKNTGNETDRYNIVIKINGIDTFLEEGFLEPGESKTISEQYNPTTIGEYVVEAGNFTRIFNLVEAEPDPTDIVLRPANLVVKTLEIVPETVKEGESLSIFVEIENTGEVSGERSFALYLNAIEVDAKGAYLQAGGKTVMIFTVSSDSLSGVNTIEVSELSQTFTVVQEQTPFWKYIAIIGVLLAVIIGYYIQNTPKLRDTIVNRIAELKSSP